MANPNTYDELAFEERLSLLVEQEHLSRENNRTSDCVNRLIYGFKSSLKSCGFPQLGIYEKNRYSRSLKGDTYCTNRICSSLAQRVAVKPSWRVL